jgi:hypothetical protein
MLYLMNLSWKNTWFDLDVGGRDAKREEQNESLGVVNVFAAWRAGFPRLH